MAKSVALSEKAKADLRGIWSYTADHWGEPQADRYYRDIIATFDLLATGARDGRRADVRAGYLKYPVGRHMVYFTSSDSRITVIRVLHQRMDVDRHL